MGPEALAQVLRPLTQQTAPAHLLVGLNAVDDAAVYRVSNEQAIISTADFFPPVVDDPYTFGAIAAANALSDVYAMGGQVLMAINLVAWPDNLESEVLSEVLHGGLDIVAQSGGVIAGGHTVTDREPKYGLSVTGTVHPERILTKGGAKPGDILVLSKPLGTGILTTAHKRELIDERDLQVAVTSMMRLNRQASEALVQLNAEQPGSIHAVTDITGFGLLGHAWEMALQSHAGMQFQYDALPQLPGIYHYAEIGCVTGGAHRNEAYLSPHVRIAEQINAIERELLWDPQTSGGLFAAIDPSVWRTLATLAPEVMFWRVGEVTATTADETGVLLEVV